MRRTGYPKLPPDWCRVEIGAGVETSHPGLYKWIIEGRGAYIGKYTRISRPTRQYQRNVERLMAGLAYRKGKPDGYRRIHRELREAVREGRSITLVILENCPVAELNRREQQLIRDWGSLNDPPFGLRPISSCNTTRAPNPLTPPREPT